MQFMAACFVINLMTMIDEPQGIVHYTNVYALELTSRGTLVMPPKPAIVLYAMFDFWDGSRLKRFLISVLSTVLVLYLMVTAQMYSSSFVLSCSVLSALHCYHQLIAAGVKLTKVGRLQPDLYEKLEFFELGTFVGRPPARSQWENYDNGVSPFDDDELSRELGLPTVTKEQANEDEDDEAKFDDLVRKQKELSERTDKESLERLQAVIVMDDEMKAVTEKPATVSYEMVD
jgi:hypothetical protein